MSDKKYTLGEVLARLTVDVGNMNEFLYSLQKMLESKSENIDIKQKLEDGSETTINVPSFGYLKGRIDRVDDNFNRLVSTNDEVIGIKSANGDVRKFDLKKVSQLIADLENIEDTSITVPTEFRIKNNWFFESFLNPLLFVSADITSILTDDIDRFSVKRIIVNTVEDADKEFFDDNYKNANEIDLEDLLLDLESNGIDYVEDDNIVDLPVGINRYRGTFDVLRMFEEEVIQTINGEEEISIIRKRYKLSTLQYTDVLDGEEGVRLLTEGDVLLTSSDSEYKVVSVNATDTEVVLERVFGIQPVTIGADIFRIRPSLYRVPEVQVNVGFNERQVIFLKPISRKNNITVDSYSNGFGIFTNELKITLDDESESTLGEYYTNFVSDFGMVFLGAAKERKMPAIVAETIAETLDPPVLSADNFKVVEIDQHIKEDENIVQLQGKIKEKEDLNSQKKETDRKLDELKSKLISKVRTAAEKQRIEKEIQKKVKDRRILQDRVSSIVKDVTLSISTTPQFVRSPKYRVRGFWQIPDPKDSDFGKQAVAQFKYRFRYLSKKGNAPNALQNELIQADGTSRFAVFSPWEEVLTKPRIKKLNEETGLYEWQDENVTDADAVNSNQLDIAIRKGETVEIQVKSLYEAGWPDNPAESEWSPSVQVQFPEDIESTEEAIIISQKAFAEEARIDFEDELVARGLDLHLGDQFTTGERFFPHKADSIASGFFTSEGNVIDLFEKLKEQDAKIEALQQAIQTARGVIKVSLIDPEGNVSEITNGQTIDTFAGFYRDLIKDTSGGSVIYNEGRIITKQYIVSIENTSETPLELISLLKGGIDEIATTSDPISFPDVDYHINRRYDLVPFSITENPDGEIGGVKHIPSTQSGQVKSQYIHSRYKDYGLVNELYENDTANGVYTEVGSYGYQGQTVSGDLVPYNWGHYLPFDPTFASTFSTNVNVWDGTTDGSENPNGSGYLSEFCIHIDHPELENLGVSYDISTGTNLEDLFRPKFAETVSPPTIDEGANQVYLDFSHALHFETAQDARTNSFGVNYIQQAERVTPLTVANNNNREDSNYPIKLGFTENDEYLIGKYTCGAYLYAFPLNYQTVSIDGNQPNIAFKSVENGSENAINIPVIFQFRCSDILGNVGGFRTDETLKNVRYTKKIGFDIYVQDGTPFSFDLQIGCRYRKETSLDAPIVPNRGLTGVNF